jgi:hypothetical protein
MRQTNIFDFLIESFTDNISNIEDTRKQRTNIIYSYIKPNQRLD